MRGHAHSNEGGRKVTKRCFQVVLVVGFWSAVFPFWRAREVRACAASFRQDLPAARFNLLPMSRRLSSGDSRQTDRSTRSSDAAPTSSQGHEQRGYELARNGDMAGATLELREALQSAPNNARLLEALGVLLAQQGELKEAIPFFDRALAQSPENIELLQKLGIAEWQLGRLPQARRHLSKVRNARPGNPEVSLILGMVLENSGEYAKAAPLLASVPDLTRSHPEAIAALV